MSSSGWGVLRGGGWGVGEGVRGRSVGGLLTGNRAQATQPTLLDAVTDQPSQDTLQENESSLRGKFLNILVFPSSLRIIQAVQSWINLNFL